jgi:AraC-like DNA-binding protein
MAITVLQGASFIAIFQAVFMAVFFLQHTKNSRLSNIILACMLLIFSVINASSLYLSIAPLKMSEDHHKLLFFLGHLAFLIGPLLYFYMTALLDHQFRLRAREWIHVGPFLVAIICSIVIIGQYQQFFIWKYPGRIYFSGFILLQNIAYAAASFSILKTHGLTVSSFLSYIDNSRLAWARFFIGGYIVLWSVQLQLFVGWDVLQSPKWCPYATSLYFLCAFLFFNGMVYAGLKRPEMFHHTQKYRNSVLKEDEKTLLHRRLLEAMDTGKLFLDPSVTLTSIAQHLDVAPCSLSQVINESCGQNFRDFINSYRIKESKRLLIQPDQHLNILGIALDAGFNSKSAFNTAFKKLAGMTPKEYRASVVSKAAGRIADGQKSAAV